MKIPFYFTHMHNLEPKQINIRGKEKQSNKLRNKLLDTREEMGGRLGEMGDGDYDYIHTHLEHFWHLKYFVINVENVKIKCIFPYF